VSKEILPGDGYRLIDKEKDTKRPGDEYWSNWFNRWIPVSSHDWFRPELTYRRKLPAKPEEVEIHGYRVSLDNGFVRIADLFSHFHFSSRPEAIRQLSQWLTQVADWREAQEQGEQK
jgi:hypothetical protein